MQFQNQIELTAADQEYYQNDFPEQYAQQNAINSPYGRPLMMPQIAASTLPMMRNGNNLQDSPGGSIRKSKRPISAVNGKLPEPQTEYLQQMFQPYMNQLNKKFQLSQNDFMNSTYRKKLIPASMMYKKEDLYDQNIYLKLQLNDYKEDNLKLRTRVAQLLAQIGSRDKLFDDLYKSAFITSQGTFAKNNLNKDALLIINLKRQVQDLKDNVFNKDAEIYDLKKEIKSTKIKELEIELKTYMQECLRLRQITEQAIKFSGEIDLKKIQQANIEQSQQFQLQTQNFKQQLNDQAQQYQKLQNTYSQAQLDIQNQQQKIEFYENKLDQLQNTLRETEQDRAEQIDLRDQEIKKHKNQIKKLKKEIEDIKQKLAETEAMIPKRPEKEYIEEIEVKRDKIEQLCEELIMKDNTIAQQAILNKNIQKSLDASNHELNEYKKHLQDTQQELTDLNNENKQLDNELKSLQDKYQSLKNDKDRIQGEYNDYQDSQQAKLKKVQEEIITKIQEINRLKNTIEELENTIKDNNYKLSDNDEQITELLEKINSLTVDNENHKLEIEDLNQKLKKKESIKQQQSSSSMSLNQKKKIQKEDSEEEHYESQNKTILSQSIIDKEKAPLDEEQQEEINQIVEQTELVLKDVAQSLIDKKLSLRQILEEENIYTVRVNKEGEEQVEKEVVLYKHFISKLDSLSSIKLQASERAFIRRIFSSKINDNLIQLDQIAKILSNLGVIDYLPKPKKRLNYDKLNLKSIRILNRLLIYLEEHQQTVDDVFGDKIIQQNVKAKDKTEQVELIKDIDFFDKLYELEIIITNEIKSNLALFLCIDESFKTQIMMKKLRRVMTDFQNSEGLKSIGIDKRKLPESLETQLLRKQNEGQKSTLTVLSPSQSQQSQYAYEPQNLIKAQDYIKLETGIKEEEKKEESLMKAISRQSSKVSEKLPPRQQSAVSYTGYQPYNHDQTQTLVGYEMISTNAVNNMIQNKNEKVKTKQSSNSEDFNQRQSESRQDTGTAQQENNEEEEKSEYTYKEEEVDEYYSESQGPETNRNASVKQSQEIKKADTIKVAEELKEVDRSTKIEKKQTRLATDDIFKLESQYKQHDNPGEGEEFDPFNPFPQKQEDEGEPNQEESYYDEEEAEGADDEEPDFERDDNQREILY
ncbi:UNKNOWN [Stylonychia lemnae]|uniref:Uncharacterized protein n=1 Tax=Stylonychia lemnae TaxID=5949 RepID=A0A078B6A2_STYLE|nr:UNKNOWN [Stylonychia lemnae]|eukprot:CDW90055.1 UNKNOWN [Stylonychia lemnae]